MVARRCSSVRQPYLTFLERCDDLPLCFNQLIKQPPTLDEFDSHPVRTVVAVLFVPARGYKVEIIGTDDRIDFSSLVQAKSSEADLVVMGFTEERLRQKGSELLLRHPSLNEVLWVAAHERISME